MSKKNHQLPGFLISFEGSEGSGKSTQVSRIATLLEDAGQEVVVTREPGGTEIGEEIRHLLKFSRFNAEMFSETELLLFAAARAQLVREVMLPALKEGKIILCDRFLDSTTVYQGVARQLNQDPVRLINEFAVGEITPDLTVILDVPAEVGLKRIRTRASDLPDRMEAENIEFYKSVREGYLILAKTMPQRFHVVNGETEVEAIEQDIWEAVSELVLDDEG